MKVFGSISRLVSIQLRKNSQDITLRPNQSTTYSAARDIQLPSGDTDHVLVSVAGTQTLTGKTIDGDDNTIQDLALTSLKTILADADKVLLRDVTGLVISAKILNTNIDPSAAIDATKIANGSVSNTEFQYLDGVTSAIQTQLDSKLNLSGGTLTGALVLAADPVTALGAATKQYVDNSISGIVGGDMITYSSSIISVDLATASGLESTNPGNAGGQLRVKLEASNPSLRFTGSNELAVKLDAAGAIASGSSGLATQVDNSTIEIATNTLRIKSGGITNTQISASAAISLSKIETFRFEADWALADGTTKVVTHNLATKNVAVHLYDKTDDQQIWVDTIIRTDTNTVTLTSSAAPGASGWKVLIIAI